MFIPPRILQMRRELYRRGEWTPDAEAYSKELRLDRRTVEAHAGIFAVCLLKFYGSNTGESIFDFDPSGIPSAVIEAFAFDGHTVIDLIAWPLHAPGHYASAVREADMLGITNMLKRGGVPLVVHRTPEQWLASGCEGCVVINHEWGGYWLNRAGGPFVARDIAHGREIRDALGRDAARHRIMVPEKARAA